MPPKKKEAPKNAFFYFMMEVRDKQGRNFRSMQDVSYEAGQIWSKMSKEQKRPYEEQAFRIKNDSKPGKYTSQGFDIERLEKIDREEGQRIAEMKNDINQELKVASSTGGLKEKTFFLIHINTFCYASGENCYYPAEIAVAGFNLENGVVPGDVFYRMIKPGGLPLGYAGVANVYSRENHQIEPPDSLCLENNLEEVFYALREFCQTKMPGSRRMPTLYCDVKHTKMIHQVLNTWCMNYDNNTKFNVYNLQYFFRVLKNSTAKDSVWSSDTYSTREIEKDVYAYAKGIACTYHDTTNVPQYCSRSIVLRYAYIICDTCCQDLSIDLIPGYHLPENSYVQGMSSSASFVSSRSSRSRDTKPTTRDDSDSVVSFSTKSDWENQSTTSETASSIVLNDDEHFPSLGGGRSQVSSSPSWKYFSPSDASSVVSQSNPINYAGATGRSGLSSRPADMPSSVMNSMEKLSLGSARSSETFSLGHGTTKGFDNVVSNFPKLGRGNIPLAFKGRGVRRPKPE